MGELENTIIILQVYQSVQFAIVFFAMYIYHGNYSKKFLGWFMVLAAVFALSKATGSQSSYHMFRYLFPPGVAMLLALFPLFYFYIKSLIIPGYRFRSKEMIHLLPAAILFILPVPLFFLRGGSLAQLSVSATGPPDYSWPDVIRHAYDIGVYGYFSWQMVTYSTRFANLFRLHKSNIERSFSYTSHFQLYWVFTLTMLFFLFLIMVGVSQFIGLGRYSLFHNLINLTELLIILCFSLFALLQQDIYPHPGNSGSELAATREVASLPEDSIESGNAAGPAEPLAECFDSAALAESCDEEDGSGVKKYANSGLTAQQKKVLGKKLDQLMKEKFFLNTKLTIDDVAGKLGTNSKYLSQMINESHRKNFYTYINTFRVEEAQRLLNDPGHQKYSIQGIARLAGFSSKSSFNEAFRRIAGMTPSEYIERK